MTSSRFEQVLKKRNKHLRDTGINYDEKQRRYIVSKDPRARYTRATTLTSNQFPKFDADAVIRGIMSKDTWNPSNKYWGMTPEEIKESWSKKGDAAASAGTALHEDIEAFMNQYLTDEHGKLVPVDHEQLVDSYYEDLQEGDCSISNDSEEWSQFMEFVNDHPDWEPYRTEWVVYDEDLKIAGSIDMVYINRKTGKLYIVDWKRVTDLHSAFKKCTAPHMEHVPDSKIAKYSFQVNVYKAILERKYNVKVDGLFEWRFTQNIKTATK